MTYKLDELMKKYWDAVDARQHEEAALLMKEIGKLTIDSHTKASNSHYLGGKNARW